MNCARGEWTIKRRELAFIVKADNKLIATVHQVGVETNDNADLIAAAVNACIKLNPGNPMAVAESIGEMYGVCQAIMEISWALRECGYHTLVNLAEQVLAKIEGGK